MKALQAQTSESENRLTRLLGLLGSPRSAMSRFSFIMLKFARF